jgi:GTP-binding protein
MILDKVPSPEVNIDGPLRLQISALDSNSYVGVIGIGRIKQGSVKPNDQVTVINRAGETERVKFFKLWVMKGLERMRFQMQMLDQ